ncbi:3-keto-5-aminohexanoate cleavage protein, partial [Rhizobium ruizarguesonis]
LAFVFLVRGTLDEAELVALLRTLGFKKTAIHRTQKVSLFEQGEIRILVNVDPAGFAPSSSSFPFPFSSSLSLLFSSSFPS